MNYSLYAFNTLEYKTSSGIEYFIQALTKENKLAGFLRLTIYTNKSLLINVGAMIREVHVYGFVKGIGEQSENGAQHFGIGTSLLNIATEIAERHNVKRLGVIAGVGTRDYYRKRDFYIEHNYGYGIKSLEI